MRAESADRSFLNRNDDFVRCHQAADQVFIERLGKAQVGNGGRQALGVERIGSLECFRKAGAE